MLDIQKAIWCRDNPLRLNVQGFEGNLFDFQVRDVGYLFFIRRALNANQTGLGKTIEMIALNLLQRQHNRLKAHIQVVPAQSLYQWYGQYKQFAPSLIVRVALGKPVDRISIYNSPFDVLLVSYNTLWHDWQYVATLKYNSISFDEATFFKNSITKTHEIVSVLSKKAEWVVPITATPIQNCVTDLWSIYQTLNMPGLLGSHAYFMNRYCVEEIQTIITRSKDNKRVTKRVSKVTAYKNLNELKVRINPFYLRRRVSDPEVEATLPALVHDVRWLELLPEQRAAYEEVKVEVIRRGYRGRELRNKFHTMKKIVDGMRTLDEHGQDISVKSDEVMRLLTGDLVDDKVVLFSWYKASIRALEQRIKPTGTQYDFIWGDIVDKAQRFRIQQRFHDDPNLKLIMGTTALEMSLNLQPAKFMIFYSSLYNAARNIQIVGRIRRIGSEHGSCVIITLVCKNTLEEKMMTVLQRRAALSDFVFNEALGEDMYDKLSDDEIYNLIRD